MKAALLEALAAEKRSQAPAVDVFLGRAAGRSIIRFRKLDNLRAERRISATSPRTAFANQLSPDGRRAIDAWFKGEAPRKGWE